MTPADEQLNCPVVRRVAILDAARPCPGEKSAPQKSVESPLRIADNKKN
jgi:hypothetical protein